MTEIAVRQETLPDLPPPPVVPTRSSGNPAADMLVSWARGAQAADYLAGPVSETKFAGAFRGDKDAATAAILYGAEVGLSPIQSLQSVHVVKDRPAFYARTMQAIVLAAGHEVWTETSSATRVIVCGRRRGGRNVERVEWTMQRATTAGYVAQNANYRKDPEAMLWARAMSECCRRLAPDALSGLVHSIEELEDEAPEAVQTMRRTATASEQAPMRRTARRRQEPMGPPEPELDPTPRALDESDPDEPAPEAAPEPVPHEPGKPPTPPSDAASRAQVGRIQALFNATGVIEQPDRLRYVEDVVGHPVDSTNDLTKDEASSVIDALQADRSSPSSGLARIG